MPKGFYSIPYDTDPFGDNFIRSNLFKNPISFRDWPYNRSFYYSINIRICLFFILMKLWLHYLTEPYRRSKIAENLVDVADAITSVPDFSPTSSAPNITGHGGEFGGGGASGAWTEAGGIAETASTVGETATEAAGEAVSGLTDEGGIILLKMIDYWYNAKTAVFGFATI